MFDLLKLIQMKERLQLSLVCATELNYSYRDCYGCEGDCSGSCSGTCDDTCSGGCEGCGTNG